MYIAIFPGGWIGGKGTIQHQSSTVLEKLKKRLTWTVQIHISGKSGCSELGSSRGKRQNQCRPLQVHVWRYSM